MKAQDIKQQIDALRGAQRIIDAVHEMLVTTGTAAGSPGSLARACEAIEETIDSLCALEGK